MRISTFATEIRRQLAPLRSAKTIALVPTMGCLHEGHLSLIHRAKDLADIVVVSIYVNPLQFAPNEDLDSYPRIFDADARLCQKAGVDFIFHPRSLYPANGPRITLKAGRLCDCLCGVSRPGHFDGVVTAVNILFNIIQPDLALFGEKDWQQLAIIRSMVADLQMPIEIVGSETVREPNGLAKSSRNRYLSNDELARAVKLSQALGFMQDMAAGGEKNAEVILASTHQLFADAGIATEYLEIRHGQSLKRKKTLTKNQHIRAFVAAKVGNTRLIDNMPLYFETVEERMETRP